MFSITSTCMIDVSSAFHTRTNLSRPSIAGQLLILSESVGSPRQYNNAKSLDLLMWPRRLGPQQL